MGSVAQLRAPSKPGRQIKPHRVKARPDAPFGEGILPEETPISCPIDQRPLPNINGSGLTCEESRRITGAKNRAFAEYAHSCPEASLIECDRVARKAAADEMRRLLKERPPAPPLKVKGPESQVTTPTPIAKPARNHGRCMPFTAEDATWWVENSPSRNYGYEVLSMGRRWDRRADEAVAQHLLEVGLAS